MVSSTDPRGSKLRVTYALVIAAAVAAAACASIIGIQDRSLDPAFADGGGTHDGAPPGDSPGQDSSTTDSSVTPDGGGDGGACGDTTSDGKNCGRCGHDCLGGMCMSGVCQPISLASSITPFAIAVDSTSVYWTSFLDTNVVKADKNTGANPTILMSYSDPQMRIFLPTGIALDDGGVFVADQATGYVLSCPIGGCGNNPTTVAFQDGGSPLLVAVDSTSVYWTDGLNDIWKAPRGGGAVTHVSTYAMGKNADIKVDSQFIYWTVDDGTVQKVALAGGAPTKLVGGQANANWMTLGNNSVYWTTLSDPGVISGSPLMGAMVNILAGGQHSPEGVAVDGTNIYWATFGTPTAFTDGTVMTCPLTNCSSPTTLASSQQGARSVAVDANAVYWTTQGSGMQGSETGTVMKVAKP
jgi:hypothetical protein